MAIDANDNPMVNVGSIQPVRPVDMFDEAAIARGARSIESGTNAAAGLIASRNAAKVNDIRDGEFVSEVMKIDAELSLRKIEDQNVSPDQYEQEILAERNQRIEDKATEILDGMNLSGGQRKVALESFQSVYQGRAEGALRQSLMKNVIAEHSLHHSNNVNNLVDNHRYVDAFSSYAEDRAVHLSDSERDEQRRKVAGLAAQHIVDRAKLGLEPDEGAIDAIPLMNDEQREMAELGLVIVKAARENPKKIDNMKQSSDQYIESMSLLYEDGLTEEEAGIARNEAMSMIDKNVDAMVFTGLSAEEDREKYRQSQIDDLNKRLVDNVVSKLDINGDFESATVAINSLGLPSDQKDAAIRALNSVQKGNLTEEDQKILGTEVESRYIEILEGVMSGDISAASVDTHQFDNHDGLTSAAKNRAVLRLMSALSSAEGRKKARLDIESTVGDHSRAAALRDGNKAAFDAELQIRFEALQSPGESDSILPMTQDEAMAKIVHDFGMVPPGAAALWRNLGVSNKDEQIDAAMPIMAAVLRGQNSTVLEEADIPEHIIAAADEFAVTGNIEQARASVRGGAKTPPRLDYDSNTVRHDVAKQALGGLGVGKDALKELFEDPLFAQYMSNVQNRLLGEGRNISPSAVVAMIRNDSQTANFPLSYSPAGGLDGESVWMRGQSPEQALKSFVAVRGVDEDLAHRDVYAQIGMDVAESEVVKRMRASGELPQKALDMLNNNDFAGFAQKFLVLEHVGFGYTEETMKNLSNPNSLAMHERVFGKQAMPTYHARIVDDAGTQHSVVSGNERIHIDPTALRGWAPENRKSAPQDVKGYYQDSYKGAVDARALSAVGQTGFKLNGTKMSFQDMVGEVNTGNDAAERRLENAAAISMILQVATNSTGQNVKTVEFMDGDLSIPLFKNMTEGDFKKEFDKVALAIDWLIENADETRKSNGVPPASINKHRGAFKDTSIAAGFAESADQILIMLGYGDNQAIFDSLVKGSIRATSSSGVLDSQSLSDKDLIAPTLR